VSATLTPEDRQAIEALSVEWARRLDHARWHDMTRAAFGAWADERATRPQRRTQHRVTNLRMRAVADGWRIDRRRLVPLTTDAD